MHDLFKYVISASSHLLCISRVSVSLFIYYNLKYSHEWANIIATQPWNAVVYLQLASVVACNLPAEISLHACAMLYPPKLLCKAREQWLITCKSKQVLPFDFPRQCSPISTVCYVVHTLDISLFTPTKCMHKPLFNDYWAASLYTIPPWF